MGRLLKTVAMNTFVQRATPRANRYEAVLETGEKPDSPFETGGCQAHRVRDVVVLVADYSVFDSPTFTSLNLPPAC